jgi:hypothetical protein
VNGGIIMSINYNASDFLNRITNNNNYYYTSSYTKNVREADDEVESFQSKFSEFRKIVRRLNNYNSNDTTEDKLKDYLSDLADTYNSMSKKAENITDSSLKKYLNKLDTLIDDNAKSLKKLGLKKNDDGELEFDEDTFDDDFDQKVADKLFTGTDSFIDQARKLMRNIDYSASDAEFVTTEKRFYDGIKYSNEEITQAKAYLNLLNNSTVLNTLSGSVKDGSISNIDKEDMYSVLESVRDNLNLLGENGKEIYENEKYNADFANLGFSLENNSVTFSRNAESVDTSDGTSYSSLKQEFIGSLTQLFGDESSNDGGFMNWLKKYCQDGYNKTIKLEEIRKNISSFAIDEYV